MRLKLNLISIVFQLSVVARSCFYSHPCTHLFLIHHADETASSSSTADPGLHRSRSLSALFLRSNVHQSKVAVNNIAGSRLSHVMQYYRSEWMYYYDKGEFSRYNFFVYSVC